MLAVDVVQFVLGLAILAVASDRFVLGAARLSTALRISPVIVGAIVIGFGTSAPEFVVTILATLRGSQDLAFGNLVGSNTANLLLVIGGAALFRPLPAPRATVTRELPLMLVALLALTAALVNGQVTTVDAVALLVGAGAAIGLIIWLGVRDREFARTLETQLEEQAAAAPERMSVTLLLVVLGLVGTIGGAELLIRGASDLARALGISEAVIGLTVVAVGTSLPELVTAVAAARRRETSLIVGNVLGSNVFNSLPVAGVAGALATVRLDPALGRSLVLMLVAAALTSAFLVTDRQVGRVEAALLLTAFAATVAVTA